MTINPDTGNSHFVLGQCSGLVGPDHGGGTERLDGGEPADQCIAGDHLAHAEGQTDGDHGRQAFGHRSNGQAHGDQEHVQRIVAAQIPDCKYQRANKESGDAQSSAKLIQPLLQRRRLLLCSLQHFGNQANLGAHAGVDYNAAAAAVANQGSHEGGVGAIAQGNIFLLQAGRGFLHRHRFAGEGGFFDA